MDVTDETQARAALKKASDEVRRSESRRRPEQGEGKPEPGFQPILANIPGFVAVMGTGGEVEFVSQELMNYFGRSVEELSSWDSADAVHPDDLPGVLARWKRSVETGDEYEIDHRIRRADGIYRWFHVRGRPERDAAGRIVRWHQALIDIEDRKRDEESARANERDFRLIIDSIPGLIHTMKPSGEVEFVSQPVLDFFGKTLEEMNEWLSLVHPDDRARVIDVVSHAIEAGQFYETECRVLRADGIYRWFSSRGRPLRDAEGRIVRWYNLLIDIDDRKRTEESLQRSEFYLAKAEGLAHTASWSYDLVNPRIIYWSAEQFKLERRDPSKPLPPLTEVSEGFTHEDWATLMEHWEESIRERIDFTLETRRRLPDGSIQYLRVAGHPLENAAGDVIEMMGTTMDITEQAQARAALKKALDEVRRSEDQLRLIIDTIPALAWSTGPDGSLEFVNRRWRDYTGLSTEEVRGWGWKSALYSDDIEHLIEVWSEALTSGEATECEARLRRFDGEFRWFLFRTVPLRDESGNVVKWYGTNTDIEDRKRAEEALRESATDLRLIVDTIPALVWYAKPDGRVEYVNQRILDFVGASVSDLVEHGWINFIHPDDAESTLASWFHAIGTGGLYDAEYKMRAADGSYRWFHVLGEPLRNAEGRIIRWYGLIADIEDRKNAAEILRRTQARLSQSMQIATIGEFAASIAHEVNQPLAAVVANGHACLRWLLAEPPNLAEANLAAERIIRDGNGAAEVVRRIRALFKQAEPEMIRLDLNEVLTEVVRLLKGETERHGVLVETDLEEALPPVMADRLQLQQVIFNLLQNGIEAMDNVTDCSKRLVIRSKRQNSDAILVEIRDHGSGLSDFDKPFDAFYTTKGSGMGMGLAICRSIIDAHRGRLWAAPTEGPGATFCFTLPLDEGAASRNSDPY